MINYAPNTRRIRDIIMLANRTFDDFATIFTVVKCLSKLQHSRRVSVGDPGLLIDRWYNTPDNTQDLGTVEAIIAHRPPDGTWLLPGGSFSAPTNVGERFMTRIRGIFVPKVTGMHKFSVMSDDAGQVYVLASLIINARFLSREERERASSGEEGGWAEEKHTQTNAYAVSHFSRI